MKARHRKYSGYEKDYFDMRNLLIESYGKYEKPLNWLIGRLDNWRFAAFTARIRTEPYFYQRNAHLWRNDDGGLIGFFISENGKEYFELQVHPDYRFIEEDMLQWVFDDWSKGKNEIVTNIYVHDTSRAKLLEKFSFDCLGVVGVDYRYHLENYVDNVDIEGNFRIASFSESYDVESRSESERLTVGRDTLDREWFETKTIAPGYSSDWDLAVVSPDGQVAAFCVAWLDEENSVAEIDPVGTHPDYRKKGLAKALLTSCFVRLNRHGIKKAQIQGFSEPAKNLYSSLMPAEEYEICGYKLKLR